MTDEEDKGSDRHEAAIRELKKSPARRRRDGYIWLILGFILGGMVVGMLVLDRRIDQANQKTNSNATIIETQSQWIEQQREQFEDCKGKAGINNPRCVKPVVPSVTLTPERVESSPKEKALSEDQIRAIAVSVVAKSTWNPTTEQTNAIARIAFQMIPPQPTTQQINNMLAATVATYCANDRCKGKDAPTITPAPGKDGTPGADSTVPGPRGQDATDEQVAAGVAAWCAAHDDCKGPQGPAGRGLVSLICRADDGRLVATYTDDTSQVIEGSDCTADPGPTTTVTETTTVPPKPTDSPLIKVGR
jgi:hypothetical protein